MSVWLYRLSLRANPKLQPGQQKNSHRCQSSLSCMQFSVTWTRLWMFKWERGYMPYFRVYKPSSANYAEESQLVAWQICQLLTQRRKEHCVHLFGFSSIWGNTFALPWPPRNIQQLKVSNSKFTLITSRKATGECQHMEAVLLQHQGDPGSHCRFPACVIIS